MKIHLIFCTDLVHGEKSRDFTSRNYSLILYQAFTVKQKHRSVIFYLGRIRDFISL